MTVDSLLQKIEGQIAALVAEDGIGDYRIFVASDTAKVLKHWAAKNPRVCFSSRENQLPDGSGIAELGETLPAAARQLSCGAFVEAPLRDALTLGVVDTL